MKSKMKMNNFLILLLILFIVLLFLVYYYKYLRKQQFESFKGSALPEADLTVFIQLVEQNIELGKFYGYSLCFETGAHNMQYEPSGSTNVGTNSFQENGCKGNPKFKFKATQDEINQYKNSYIIKNIRYKVGETKKNKKIAIYVPLNLPTNLQPL